MLTHSNTVFFNALSDPTRIKITEMVARQGKMSAGDISANFTVSFASISQHLKVLREADVLSMEKRAQQRLYAVNLAAFDDITEWIAEMRRLWELRFDQLDQVLRRQAIAERVK